MKKLSFIGLTASLFLFISCTDTSKTETSSTTVSNAEKNSANSREIYKGIETGDMSKVNFLADDIVDHEHPNGTGGRDSVMSMLGDMHNHVKDLKFELISDATSADGQYHFALVRMTGTTIDDKMGMPANMSMDHLAVDVVKLSDGKATEHWGFNSRSDMMKMMGGNKMQDKMDAKLDSTKK